jgi:hypothetical protein
LNRNEKGHYKRYLGDSVYVELTNGMAKLTTENGYGPSNTIYMEIEVINALNQWIIDISRDAKAEEEQP